MAEDKPLISIDLLHAALLARNYSLQEMKLGGKTYTLFTSAEGKSWLTKNARIGYPFSTSAAREISRSKNMAHEFAAQLGVASPHSTAVTSQLSKDEMKALLQQAPLVVKPENSSASNGVTLEVRELPLLEAALSTALAVSDVALVQSQVEGDEIRFVVIEGQVRAAVLRQTPRLIGDGKSKVGELLAAENIERAALELPYLEYPQLTEDLIDFDGIDLDHVPPAGEVLELSRATMIRTGASIYDVLDKVHPSYVEVAAKLATGLAARFLCVDVIIQDYSVPADERNYAFLEFNTSPALKLFYSCRDGKHYDILTDLTNLIDKTLAG